jgi:hypothetical protein
MPQGHRYRFAPHCSETDTRITASAFSQRLYFGEGHYDMEPISIILPEFLKNAAVLTILLAFAGYLVTYIFTRKMARRADQLRLVDQRLNQFYGPLYVATVAGNIAYRALLTKQDKIHCHPIRDEDLKEWLLWMTTIFMPLNDIREKIIIENAHLIVEEQMPQCLLDFVTHVVGYKALLAKWQEGDYSERRSMIGWPPEFDVYVERSYQALKAEQTRLLHSAFWGLWHRAKKPTSISGQ